MSKRNTQHVSSKIRFTEREGEVVRFLIRGKSNNQIALELEISPRAVEQHLTHIYEKIGVSSRAEAIIKLIHMLE